MSIFLKKYGAFKKKFHFESEKEGNLGDIFTKYNIDLSALFPNLNFFTVGHRVSLNNKSKSYKIMIFRLELCYQIALT